MLSLPTLSCWLDQKTNKQQKIKTKQKQKTQYFSFLEPLVQWFHLYFLTNSFQIPAGKQMQMRRQVQRSAQTLMQNFRCALLFDDPILLHFTTLILLLSGEVCGLDLSRSPKEGTSGGVPSILHVCPFILGSFSLHPHPPCQPCSCMYWALVFIWDALYELTEGPSVCMVLPSHFRVSTIMPTLPSA